MKSHYVFVPALLLAFLVSNISSAGPNSCEKFLLEKFPPAKSDAETIQYLMGRYGVEAKDIQFTENDHYPVIVRGVDQATLTPSTANLEKVEDTKVHEVIVVGGGPAGLTSALYLTDQGKEVLVIDPNVSMGGLAQGNTLNGIRVGAGAAYSAGADNLAEYKIFQHIGVGDYKSKLTIKEPIDSLYLNGQVYAGIWEKDTLKRLPASFSVFKRVLRHMVQDPDLYDLTKATGKALDNQYAADLIRKMPDMLAQLNDTQSKSILKRFLSDPSVDKADPMKDVIGLMNRYCRSALGDTSDKVSAYSLVDFYEKEMGPRYTGTYGTGEIVEKIVAKLKDPSRAIQMQTSASVSRIINTADGVEVHYVKDGKEIIAHAKSVVFSAPVKLASKIIDNFAAQAPEAAKAIDSLTMANYAVHNVRLKGHPLRETYDLWMAGTDDAKLQPTDVIQGRWQDPKIDGYQGMQNFEKNPSDDYGEMTIYQPLGPVNSGFGFSASETIHEAEKSVDFIRSQLNPYLRKKFGANIEVELIETNRWPLSVHIAHPGWMQQSEILKKPVGRIFFANNNMGLPEFERALVYGKEAADKVLDLLSSRVPASAPATIIEKFVQSLSKESSLGSESAVKGAISQFVHDNSAKLSASHSASELRSLDDIAGLSEAEQKRVVDEMARLPDFSERLAVNSNAVELARSEALSTEEVRSVLTESVPDLRSPVARPVSSVESSSSSFAKLNGEISQKSGTSVLGNDPSTIKNEQSVQNMKAILAGVKQDVAEGKASGADGVAQSLQKNMEYVLGTDEKESRARICGLGKECGVLSQALSSKMCE